jgi:ABC-type Na+ transport system ATPase subunit NatA
MQEISALSDRIVIIAGGKTVAFGTSDELIEAAGAKNLEDAFVTLTAGAPGSSAPLDVTP